MSEVSNLEAGEALGTYWYLKRVKGKIYLVKVEIINGKRRETSIGNVEVIEQIMNERKKKGSRPYWKPSVVRPPGFEPGIAGLGGRRPSPG
jgi:hypothetical protein